MERAEWLKRMRSQAEGLYDQLAPKYWDSYGFYENETHLEFLRKFLERVGENLGGQRGLILSAGCGAGRYDGLLLDAGHAVMGIDQSGGMLKRAREHFPAEQYPQLAYAQMGMQEMPFRAEFDGVICVDALEHVCPEDYFVSLCNFRRALKQGGLLYFTVDNSASAEELQEAYDRARALGLPVIYGEVADRVDSTYEQIQAMGQVNVPEDVSDPAVYHFYPGLEQARAWIEQAGLVIEEEGEGHWYHHFIARRR